MFPSFRPSQSVDPFQDVSEQSAGYGDLRHLERNVPAMSDDLVPSFFIPIPGPLKFDDGGACRDPQAAVSE